MPVGLSYFQRRRIFQPPKKKKKKNDRVKAKGVGTWNVPPPTQKALWNYFLCVYGKLAVGNKLYYKSC